MTQTTGRPDLTPQRLLDPAVIADPYPFYRDLREHAPVWNVPGTEVFTVATFEALAEAVSRTDVLSSNIEAVLYRGDDGAPARIAFGGVEGITTLATADPPVHAVHRAAVFPELVAKRMLLLEPEIDGLARGLLRDALAGSSASSPTFDFMTAVGSLVPINVVSWLVGFTDADAQMLLQAALDSTEMLAATMSLAELEAMFLRTDQIGRWLAEQMQAAMADPRADLLGAVARGIESGAFTFDSAVVVLHTLLSAGGESTSSLLGNAVRILADDPDLQQRLRADRTLIPAFVEEALRLESPFRFHMRAAHADLELAGTEIPKGSTVLMLWGAANRDPDEHERPDEVVLDRPTPRHHVAFGRGIHHCVGAPLARIEARVVLETLFDETEHFELGGEPRWANSLMVRRHEALPLRYTPR
ncbi:MAG: cytochrome P450 [Acidimicrobiia bacterium]